MAADWKKLQTFGGEAFNTLPAGLFTRLAPKRRFARSPERVVGPVPALDLSLDYIRGLADATQTAGDLPLSVAGKFAGDVPVIVENGEERRCSP
jgi:hypothetical protein